MSEFDARNLSQGIASRLQVSRRRALQMGVAGLAGVGAGLLVGCGDDDASPDFDGELEVTSVRLSKPPPVCIAAQYIAEQYLYDEGFTQVEYVPMDNIAEISPRTSDGTVDFAMHFAAPVAFGIDQGDRISVLTGMHVGCFDLYASPQIDTPQDLKGGRIAVTGIGAQSGDYLFIAGILQYIGINVVNDVTFVPGTPQECTQRLADGEVDAFLAFPPIAQDLAARGIGHVVLTSTVDWPWSQYYCCVVTGNKKFIAKHPAATKRVVRAYVRAAEHCASQPEAVADFLVANNYLGNRDYAQAMMRALPYDVWQSYDPEDTLRFYALQLHEAAVIKSTPEEIIRSGTDWRFLDDLKQELAFTPSRRDGQFSFYCDLETAQFGNPARSTRARPRSGGSGNTRRG